MKTKFFLLSLTGVGVLSAGALGFIVMMTNPFRATAVQHIFFYSALFVVCSVMFAAAAFFVLRYLGVSSEHVQGVALREGIIVAALVVVVLLLQSQGFLTTPVLAALVAVVVLIELYAASVLRFDEKMRAVSMAKHQSYEE